MVDAVRAGGLTSRVMSLGYGRELLTIACLVVLVATVTLTSSGRALAQAPQQHSPGPATHTQAPVPQAPAAQSPAAAPPPALQAAPATPAQAAPIAGPAATTTPAAPVAAGQPELPKVGPTLEATERARSAYAHGQEAFAANDFANALIAFQDAYANVPNPIVLLSIAESAAKLGRAAVAVGAYDTYLRTRPDAPDRDEVAQKRAALAELQLPSKLLLTSEPAGAEVILDGQLVGQVTPVALEIRPGPHHVSLVLTGFDTERMVLELAPAGRLERSAVLRPSPNAVLAQPAPPEKKLQPAPLLTPEPPRAAIIVTATLGAAGVIAGTVLGIFALKERSDFNTAPTEAGADRGERLALFSDVGFGIGAMSLITTAVLLFTHDPPRTAERSDTARFELTPSFTARSASASAKVRF